MKWLFSHSNQLWCFVLLLFSILSFECKSNFKGSPITSSQWEILSYIPGRTESIAYFNFDNIKATKVWNDVLKSEIEDKRFDDWISAFSDDGKKIFDKEVSKIIVSKGRNQRFFILVTADSPFQLFVQTLQDTSRFEKLEFLGEKYYYDTKSKATRYYQINDKMVAVTNNIGYLKSLIEQKQYSLDHNNNFIQMIEDIPDKTQYWFAMDSNKLIAEIHDKYFSDLTVGNNYKDALKRIRKVSLCATLDNGIKVEGVLGCWGDKSAYFIASALKSAIAMNVFSHSNYNLGKIFEKTQVSTDRRRIILTVNLNKDDIKHLQKIANENFFIMNF